MHAHTHKLAHACCNHFCRTAAPTSNRRANHNHCQPFLLEASFFHVCRLGCKNHIVLNGPCANKPSKNYQEAGTQFNSQKPSGNTFSSILNFKGRFIQSQENCWRKWLEKLSKKKKSWGLFFFPQNFSAQCFASSAHVIFFVLLMAFQMVWEDRPHVTLERMKKLAELGKSHLAISDGGEIYLHRGRKK